MAQNHHKLDQKEKKRMHDFPPLRETVAGISAKWRDTCSRKQPLSLTAKLSWKAGILFQHAWHRGGGTKVEPTLAETGTAVSTSWAGFLTNCDRLAQSPSRFMSFFFSKKTENWFHMGSEFKYYNKIQTAAIWGRQSAWRGSQMGDRLALGEKKDARYDCSRAIQNCGFAAQVSGACGELMQRGWTSARGRGGKIGFQFLSPFLQTLPFECVFATMLSLFVTWAFDHKWPMHTFATFPIHIISSEFAI